MAQRKSTAPKAKGAETKDPEFKIENALGKTEIFLERHWKTITTVVVVLLLVIGGIYAYRGLVTVPRGKKAADAMFVAEQLFAQGDFATALNGDGNNLGFADVVGKYGNTPQGRLAAHYAGICHLQEGDLDAALEYLSKYRATRGIPNAMINAQNKGLQGDIYVQKGDFTAAVSHYRKAVDAAGNILTTPTYLKKMGLAYEALNDYASAFAAYRRVADYYPASLEARDIEKFASAAQQRMQQ